MPSVQQVKHTRGETHGFTRFLVAIPEPNRFFSADR